jgi:hypothetical protein
MQMFFLETPLFSRLSVAIGKEDLSKSIKGRKMKCQAAARAQLWLARARQIIYYTI